MKSSSQYNNVIQLIFRLVEAKKTESHSKTEKEVASANFSVRGWQYIHTYMYVHVHDAMLFECERL